MILMKVIVVSDTHGRIDDFISKINSMEKPQLIIHLGDYVEDGEKIKSITKVGTIIVKGNGDYFNKTYKDDEVIYIGGKRFFITHGHKYGVKYGLNNLLYRGEEVGADIILFGHTHAPLIVKDSNIMIMNPGSASYPRGIERKKTFGIIEIEEAVSMRIEKIN